jgi:hypothetical protein
MASVAEVGSDIYRINVEIPGKPVTFSLFLGLMDQPLPAVVSCLA